MENKNERHEMSAIAWAGLIAVLTIAVTFGWLAFTPNHHACSDNPPFYLRGSDVDCARAKVSTPDPGHVSTTKVAR
jgi:hypothetical protein